MKERGILGIILAIFMINFVSAAAWLDNMLYSIGGISTVIYITIFLIIFFLINKVLSKVFAESGMVGSILSLLISFSTTYGMYILGFDIENWLYLFGIPENMLWIIIGIIIFFLMIMISMSKDPYTLRRKFKPSRILLLIGIALIAISFTDLVYQSGTTAIIGLGVFVFGLWRRRKEKQKEQGYPYNTNYGPSGNGFFRKKLNDYADPRKRLKNYKAKSQLTDLKRERFEKRFTENSKIVGRAAGKMYGRFQKRKIRKQQRQAQQKQDQRQSRQQAKQQMKLLNSGKNPREGWKSWASGKKP